MEKITTIEQFRELPLGTKLYKPGISNIKWWYYAGINPKQKDSIMLVSAGSVHVIEGEYTGYSFSKTEYWLNYDEACLQLLENAKKNVETVKMIFVDTIKQAEG